MVQAVSLVWKLRAAYAPLCGTHLDAAERRRNTSETHGT